MSKLPLSHILFLILFLVCPSLHFTLSNSNSNSKSDSVESSALYTTIQVTYPFKNLPQSSTLHVRGDNCNMTWSKGLPLKYVGNDKWSLAVMCPVATKIQMKVLINDTIWMFGANVVQTVHPSDPYIQIFPSFYPAPNSIINTSPYHSVKLNNSHNVSIYVPPSFYDNPYIYYELLVMHDGQNLFVDEKAAFGTAWRIQTTLNSYAGQGKISQIIVIGIWNTAQRIQEYTYSSDSQYGGGKANLYLDFIEEIVPKIIKQYLPNRVLPNQRYSIGGSSLGGLVSCYALITRPLVYKNSICMSSSFFWNSEDFISNVLASHNYNQNTKIYIDSGEDNKQCTIDVENALVKKGYVLNNNLKYYYDVGAQHSQQYWGERFGIPLVFLYGTQ